MSKLVCARESWQSVQPEIEKLIEEHWEEVALYKDDVPLDPNWPAYAKLADTGILCAVTARAAGELVGYALFFVTPHLHYKSTMSATNDVLFLKKSHRKGAAGWVLIRAAEKVLRGMGAQRISWHVKVQHDFGVLLKRLGYDAEETMWGKFVGSR